MRNVAASRQAWTPVASRLSVFVRPENDLPEMM
jgi:hypothetical protein